MNRWLMIGSLVGLLTASTGCMKHQMRGGCNSCGTSACSTGDCGDSSCGSGKGILGRLMGRSCSSGSCQSGSCGGCGQAGCVAGPLGWQQGGHDYSSHLQPGILGHQAANQLQNQPFAPGPPSAQVGYPYYTIRGPRDFLLDNPPSIGR